jgi:hypothetical protein
MSLGDGLKDLRCDFLSRSPLVRALRATPTIWYEVRLLPFWIAAGKEVLREGIVDYANFG